MTWYVYVNVNHAHLLNLNAPSCYLTTNDSYSEVTVYTALAYSVFMTHMDAMVMLTDDNNYSYNIKP